PTIAFYELSQYASGSHAITTTLMAEDDRNINRPRMRVERLVNVRSTHRDRPDAQQHVGVADLRDLHVAQLDGERLERVLDDGGLRHSLNCQLSSLNSQRSTLNCQRSTFALNLET